MEALPPSGEKSDLPHEPLLHDEWLMRRFLNFKSHFKSKLSPPLQEGAFHPGKNDNDGLSMSRRKSETFPNFLNEHQLKIACTHPDPKIREECGVCAFLVEFASGIGLQIDIAPEDHDLGHIMLPQIKYDLMFGENASEETRRPIRLLITKMVQEASKHLLIPPGKPNSADSTTPPV